MDTPNLVVPHTQARHFHVAAGKSGREYKRSVPLIVPFPESTSRNRMTCWLFWEARSYLLSKLLSISAQSLLSSNHKSYPTCNQLFLLYFQLTFMVSGCNRRDGKAP